MSLKFKQRLLSQALGLLHGECEGCVDITSVAGVRVAKTSCFGLATQLAKDGSADLVIVNKEPSLENLEELIELLGEKRVNGAFPGIRDIKYDPAKSKSVAESTGSHPDHTDGSFDKTPPVYFVLQYKITDPNGGGRNFFVSVKELLDQIPDQFREALQKAEVHFGREDESGHIEAAISPMLYTRENGIPGFRWRDDEQVGPSVVDDKGTDIVGAINWIRQYLKSCPRFFYMAQEGDHVLVVNDKTFHGREALSGTDSPRWLRRAWIA
jgi:hypothetical protein